MPGVKTKDSLPDVRSHGVSWCVGECKRRGEELDLMRRCPPGLSLKRPCQRKWGRAASPWRMCFQWGTSCWCLALPRSQEGEDGVTGAASCALLTRATGHWLWTPGSVGQRSNVIVLNILRMLSAVVFTAPRIQICWNMPTGKKSGNIVWHTATCRCFQLVGGRSKSLRLAWTISNRPSLKNE